MYIYNFNILTLNPKPLHPYFQEKLNGYHMEVQRYEQIYFKVLILSLTVKH